MAKKKKKKTSPVIWMLTGIFLVLLLLLVYLLQQEKDTPTPIEFTYDADFGIPLPDNYSIHGIDVSVHQSNISWGMVKNTRSDHIAIGFVFIKATEGLSDADKQFKINWQQLQQFGFTRGAYHFFIATKNGAQQAQNFIRTVQLQTGDLPPAVDVEELYGVNPTQLKKRLKDYLQTIENFYKVKPIIYTYASFYESYLGKAFDDYPLWVAHYKEPQQPRIQRPWQFWQHSNEGHINGIKTKVDFDVFNGDSAAFQQMVLH
ncbi:MAG: glycoside hydrolase family 25 protein [Sphingobacteriales bacterium]|uniref:glycoside hydrolase family 25 protein n=1 Tax=Hydrotalea flava TaxID=714549 RepID=UPI00082D8458|nr:GH25 family lysozyme [Hydrotalea flava]RTL55667.1 MAG: glycoside hydrolase family 25 protein [Sphingobacteriales bacterium]